MLVRENLFESLNKKLILYHGSNTNNLSYLIPYSNKYKTIPDCIFLTTSKRVAKDYGQYIYKCKLNCYNIKYIDVDNISYHDYDRFDYEINKAYDNNYDCVVFKNIMDSKEPKTVVPISDVYVVFDSKNVEII